MTTMFLLAAGLSALAIRAMLVLSNRNPALLADHPNQRSLHTNARPRVGGIGIWAAVMLVESYGWLMGDLDQDPTLAFTLVLACLLFVVSLIDDLRGLAISIRLSAQVACAALFVWFAQPESLRGDGALFALVIVFVIVWSANLYNFMDGADGLAGGMAVIGFATLFWAGHSSDSQTVALLAIAVSGAALGFLAFNFPPAKVFMGDAGSVPLGYLAACLSLIGSFKGYWPAWFGAVVFSPFIVDATLTLVRRGLGGHRLSVAHRDHYYQRLILSGLTHRQAGLSYYFLMLVSAICALLAKNSPQPWTILGPLVITYAALIAVLERRFRQ